MHATYSPQVYHLFTIFLISLFSNTFALKMRLSSCINGFSQQAKMAYILQCVILSIVCTVILIIGALIESASFISHKVPSSTSAPLYSKDFKTQAAQVTKPVPRVNDDMSWNPIPVNSIKTRCKCCRTNNSADIDSFESVEMDFLKSANINNLKFSQRYKSRR